MRRRSCASTSVPASRPRRWLPGLLVVVAAAAGQGVAGQGVAAEPEVRLGVVDLATVRREAEGAKAIASQLEAFVVGYQTDIEKEEAELRSAQEQLNAKKAELSAEDYTEERRKWERAVAEAQRRFLHRRQAMDQARAAAWQRLNGALDQAIREIAVERGLTVVVRREQIVFVAPGFEITEDVLARLNQALPAVPLSGTDG